MKLRSVRSSGRCPRAAARGDPATSDPTPARALPLNHRVGSSRGAVSALPPARFPDPPSEPDMPIPEHPALHRTRCPIVMLVTQRWFPVEWWLGLFQWPPTARAHVRQVSGRFCNRGASTTESLSLFLSVSLARTRASGSTARPSHRRGRSTSARDPAPRWSPSFTRPLHQPRAGIPADTDEMFVVRHLLSHGASWRTTYLQGISSEEIISTVHARRAPMMHASAGLDL